MPSCRERGRTRRITKLARELFAFLPDERGANRNQEDDKSDRRAVHDISAGD
jgi:hypothetical protein